MQSYELCLYAVSSATGKHEVVESIKFEALDDDAAIEHAREIIHVPSFDNGSYAMLLDRNRHELWRVDV
jgi:hypothetical protein